MPRVKRYDKATGKWVYADEAGKGDDGKSAYQYAQDGGYTGSEAEFAKKLAKEFPTKLSSFDNDEGFITDADVPVKSVNSKTGAVTLTASDVGARPSTWTPTYSDVGADKSGAASSAVSTHNTKTDAHNDIRLLITTLTNRLDALANSDDDTLDQMAEVVAYIRANRDLIEQVTNGKVSVTDIVNNLTTNVSNKPLSAAQGVALKALIDAITVPTKVSELTNDSGFLTSVPSEYVTETELNAKGYAKQTDVDALPISNIAYGTCGTDAATAEKVITLSNNDNWSLGVGSVVMVYFTTSNTASDVTLNVNGTGAYPIYYNNAVYTSTGTAYTGYAKRVITYMFDGEHWVWLTGGYDSNTTYKNVTLGHGYATCSTAEATAAKVGTLSSYTLTTGGIVAVKFTYAVPANATLNINSKGAKKMFYRGSAIVADVIKAGDIATFIYDGTQYQLISIDRRETETWTFTLADGSTVTKAVLLG